MPTRSNLESGCSCNNKKYFLMGKSAQFDRSAFFPGGSGENFEGRGNQLVGICLTCRSFFLQLLLFLSSPPLIPLARCAQYESTETRSRRSRSIRMSLISSVESMGIAERTVGDLGVFLT